MRTFTTHPNAGPTPPHSRLCSSSLQHLLPSPHYRPLEYSDSPPQPESTSYDPSESIRHRVRVLVSLAAAQSIIRVEKQESSNSGPSRRCSLFSIEIQSTSNTVRRPTDSSRRRNCTGLLLIETLIEYFFFTQKKAHVNLDSFDSN